MPAKKKSANGYMKKARSEARQRKNVSWTDDRTYLKDSRTRPAGSVSDTYKYTSFEPLDTYRTTPGKKRKPKRAR